jgi:two-component sensor histidine kinase
MSEPSSPGMRVADCWAGFPSSPGNFAARLRACGAQGAAIAAFDWSATPLGPLDGWPVSLRAVTHTLAASAQPMCLWYGPELTTIFNAGFAPILGKRADDALGRRLDQVWPEIFDELVPMVRQALSGETVWRGNMPLWITRNGFEELTYWRFSYSPVLDDAGRIAGFLDVVTETTEAFKTQIALEKANESLGYEVENAMRLLRERDEAERQQRVLRHELIHRMKNMLAVISAMVTHSIRNAKSLDQAAEATSARLGAYARVQEVFSEGAGPETDLAHVVAAALAPHVGGREGRIIAAGPQVRLSSKHTLAIHELSTNAVKYGALANPTGRVEVRWSTDADARFIFDWRESGGPTVAPPTSTGFGTTLIDRIVPSYFSGRADRTFAPEGMHYVLEGTISPSDD